MDDDSREFIFGWREALDDLTYYTLFGVEPGATADEIRDAFHVFCDAFHPDRHVMRTDDERDAILTIFKRGTEAYVVLGDEALRAQYDAQLGAAASPRPPRITFSPLSRPPPSRGPGAIALEESVRSPSARPFARRAEELLRSGDLRQAKLQLVKANHMDAGNETLEAALKDVEAKLGSPK
jgi:curved DNA-binding protein CbpA